MTAIRIIVDEGLRIALSAVRMAVKNDIIVGALGEHSDYDPEHYAAMARHELHLLTRQNEEYALRVKRMRKELVKSRWTSDLTDDQQHDIIQLRLRRRVHEKLADALKVVAADDDKVARLVQRAQRAASDEVSDAVSSRLITLNIDRRDPDYEELRAARTEVFLHIDFALLKLKHDAESDVSASDY
ncbi:MULTISPECIES: hypothetical protein [Cryobacterium]|uniref:Asparagine synthase n=1 Tax=Cryobacterium breve TaxID=1259258 RepID=A0ABY2J9V9_9MICO|nr:MULTISPECIES: hypothetical protein [Cryobacterium]TFC91162.1 hypothetical protein E3T20_14130 [Cryobacterium sp. TmT3-12]TFD01143.1 hypothetical protein E3O65_02285 [Cryobacterium breve]